MPEANRSINSAKCKTYENVRKSMILKTLSAC